MKIIWILAVLLAGAFQPVQAGLNAKVAKALESPVHSSFISFIGGAVVLFLYIIITHQGANLSLANLKSIPVPGWLAGALGAFYVTIVLLAFPVLGPAVTFGLIVTGQMLMSVTLDHVNVLVAHPQSVNLKRIAGIILIIAGVVIIRKY